MKPVGPFERFASLAYFEFEYLHQRIVMLQDNQSVEVLIEILNSMLAISDLFTELSQFTWLLESGVLLWKKYSRDDDAVCAYLTIIICKSSSIATPEVSLHDYKFGLAVISKILIFLCV